MIEKLVEIGILFDFYGKILSDRQYTTIELYYIYDFSLSEIGEKLNISRQGVYDTLKRAEQKLYEYEEILGLVNKFNYKADEINRIYRISIDIENESKKINNKKILNQSKELQGIVKKIMDNSKEV